MSARPSSSGANHRGVVPGIVFEVGVLHEDVRIFRRRKTEPERGAFAAIDGVKKTLNARMAELAQKLGSAVGRSVIDDDDFGIKAAIQHALDYAADRRDFVVHRNHHGNFGPLRHQLPLASRCAATDADARAATAAALRSIPILAASIAATRRRAARRRRAENAAA